MNNLLKKCALAGITCITSLIILSSCEKKEKYATGLKEESKISVGPPEDSECFYVIKKGDTLSQIAEEYKTTADELARINCIRDKDLIYEGEEIIAYENCGYD